MARAAFERGSVAGVSVSCAHFFFARAWQAWIAKPKELKS